MFSHEETLITGYQWSPADGKFIGEYQFPNNKDKEEIHMPPFTTLTAPPPAPKGKCAWWRNGQWVVDMDPEQVKEKPIIEDYAMLTEEYIQWLKDNELWDAADEAKRTAAAGGAA